jgi:methylmalonic aciduria homocystinuria type C protein
MFWDLVIFSINIYLIFQIGWYDDLLTHKAFCFNYEPNTLAFLIISTPEMFEQGFKPFIGTYDCLATPRDPIDEFVTQMFLKVKNECSSFDVEAIHDFEVNPNRRPKVLVQTAAHAAGAAYFYQRSDVKNDPWNEKKIHGVSVHPKYGGWFAMRGVLIFKDVLVPSLPKTEPTDVVKGDEKKIELLEKFNFHWQNWSFRDIVPAISKYSEQQKKYFATLPANRKDLLNDILRD